MAVVAQTDQAERQELQSGQFGLRTAQATVHIKHILCVFAKLFCFSGYKAPAVQYQQAGVFQTPAPARAADWWLIGWPVWLIWQAGAAALPGLWGPVSGARQPSRPARQPSTTRPARQPSTTSQVRSAERARMKLPKRHPALHRQFVLVYWRTIYL
jgi:hypothetical protein